MSYLLPIVFIKRMLWCTFWFKEIMSLNGSFINIHHTMVDDRLNGKYKVNKPVPPTCTTINSLRTIEYEIKHMYMYIWV